ncbi:MAG: c-type cytochrome [Dehalococcoidia bacterium]|nr:c-type cytochrome [Dehalococcoidia bacterium]
MRRTRPRAPRPWRPRRWRSARWVWSSAASAWPWPRAARASWRDGREGGVRPAPTASPMRHATVRLLLVAAALLGALISSAGPVSAHANVVGSTPTANSVLQLSPRQVEITFSEPLASDFSRVDVLNSTGDRIDLGDSVVDPADPTRMTVSLPALEPDTYTVAWRNLSTVDGHSLQGSFVFFYRVEPTATTPDIADPPVLQSPADPVVRWLVLAAAIAAAGIPMFALVVLRPAAAISRTSASALAPLEAWVRRATVIALTALLVLSAAQIWVQTSIATGATLDVFGEPMLRVARDTRWGQAWAWRVLLAGAAVGGLLVSTRVRSGWLARNGRHVSLALALGALGTFSFASHAAATPEASRPAIGADLLHLLAAAAWVGGLFGLLGALVVLRRTLPDAEERRLLAAAVPRFSLLAVMSTTVLVVTGLYSTWVQVTVFRGLASPYGWALIAKIVLFAGLLALGAVNLLRIRPALPSAPRAAGLLRRIVRVEVVLAVLVLLAVGLMTSMEPARQTAEREDARAGLRFEGEDGATQVELRLQPGTVGANRAIIEVRDRRGEPVEDAERVVLRLTYLDGEFGADSFTATGGEDGRYVAEAVTASVAGVWQTEVLVERPDAFDARSAFRFELGATAEVGSRIEISERVAWQLAVLGSAVIGVAFLAIGWTAKRDRRLPQAAVTTAGVAALSLAFVLLGRLPTDSTALAGGRNPIPPSAESVAMGQEIYTANCAPCHGEALHGDGPGGAGLEPPPADLTVHVPLHSDEALFNIISLGVTNTAMLGYEDELTADQRWHLINYLRSAAADVDAAAAPAP